MSEATILGGQFAGMSLFCVSPLWSLQSSMSESSVLGLYDLHHDGLSLSSFLFESSSLHESMSSATILGPGQFAGMSLFCVSPLWSLQSSISALTAAASLGLLFLHHDGLSLSSLLFESSSLHESMSAATKRCSFLGQSFPM